MKTRQIGRWHACAIVFAAMVAAFVSWAAEVTPEQATTAAGNWIKRGPARVKSKFRSTAAKATVTSRDSSGRVLYHAVNLEGGGFVVTSGDTRLTPVVAFSDTGCYRDDKDNPLYVLLQAGRANAVASLNAATNKGGVSNGRSAAESEWRSLLSDQQERVSNSTGSASSVSVVYVDKLIKTKWGQDSWDGYVDGPSVFNYSTPSNYVCGCVATVGAQIMRFWQYPTAEIPQFSNACAVDGSPVTRYSIAGAFNWANMPLSAETTPTVTEAQKEAIGMLTYNVGVAVGMSWHSGSSGASPFALPNALETQFGYQSGGTYVQFDAYLPLGYTARAEAIRNALYASLVAGMPVCVSIQGSVSGHAVIADGYGNILGTSYTHLNMGWAGIDDAWYDLSDALPGPGTSTYSVIDGLVFNIHPTEKGDVISGRVWSAGGADLAGATVTLCDNSKNPIETTTTSESGVYSFRVTATGTYYLQASYDSVLSDFVEVDMSALSSSGTYDMGGFVGNKWGVNLKVETAVKADAYDPGDDTAAGGTPLTPTDVEQTHGPHTLSATDSQDFFRIEMTSGTKYVFESTGGGGLLGELFSSASADPGSCVTYSSTGAVGNNFKIEYFPPSDGTYYLRVSGYGESVYSLKYSALALSTPSTYLRVEGYYPSVNCTLGSEAINFMSKIDCDGGWTVSVDDTSWVTLTTDCGVRDGYFYFSVPANTGYNRSCVFTVTAGSFTAYKYLTQYGPLGADPRKTVTFNANGGSVSPTTRTVESGASVGALPTPTRDGWTFTGWFTEVTGGTPVSAATQVTGDVTYYAQWTPDPDAFDPGDDSAAGGTLLTPTTTEQTHGPHTLSSTDLYDFFRISMTAGVTYVFETTGLSDTIGDLYSSTAANDESLVATHDDIDIDHDNRNFRIEYTPTVSQIYYLRVKAFNNSDASYSLKYSCNASAPVLYTVTFDATGGSVSPTTRTVASGASVGTLPTPTRTGWTFTGWFTAETGGTQVSAATQVTRDVTYYAQWTPVQNTVTFNANGGSVSPTTRTVASGASVGTLPTPTRTGWTFTGWFTALTGGTQVSAATQVTRDVTYYAQWTQNPGPDTPTPVDPEPGPSCYAALDAAEIVAPYEAPKAVTLQGVAYSGCGVAGVIELKLGKVNARKHTSKVSGSVTMLNGKKYTITAVTLAGVDGSAPIDVSLNVKSLGTMAVTIGGRQFAGSLSGWHVQSANVGGNWTRSGAEVYVDMTSATLPDGVLEDLLPDGEPVVASGGKWKFAKAASVKWAKPKRGAPEPDIFDEASGKGLIVDTSAGKTNLSGLKLTYTPKKGTFKGSFKMYALQGSGRTTKLKKYTVNVNGIVVDGVGYGTATCKSPSFSCPVTVE